MKFIRLYNTNGGDRINLSIIKAYCAAKDRCIRIWYHDTTQTEMNYQYKNDEDRDKDLKRLDNYLSIMGEA